MKKIEKVTIWKDGQSKEADTLEARIINDNLNDSCTFYFSLSGEDGHLTEGNVTMTDDNYLNWDGSNDYAYSYIANTINLNIIE